MAVTTSLALLLSVGLAIAQSQGAPKQCPKTQGGGIVGICVFNPDINCTGDNQCKNGQICCPSGCNSECMDPARDYAPAPLPPVIDDKGAFIGQCPPSKVSFGGICSFDPRYNCLKDSDCSTGKRCCSEGCNKVCKDTSVGPLPPSDNGSCPPVSPQFAVGACVFNPLFNCVDNSGCHSGEICCPDGCNKVCKRPKAKY